MSLLLKCVQVYSIEDSPLCLTGTAEVPLAAVCMDKVLSEEELPLKMAAFGHCFRTEAGAGGRSPRLENANIRLPSLRDQGQLAMALSPVVMIAKLPETLYPGTHASRSDGKGLYCVHRFTREVRKPLLKP